jgi:phosphoglycerate dehydrogenase-like enzyme
MIRSDSVTPANERPRVVVTFATEEPHKEIVAAVLGAMASVVYLDDVGDVGRGDVLRGAEVLLSWIPAQELGASDWPMLARLRLMQVLSAGVEHVPFARLSPDVVVAGNAGGYAEPMAEHVLAMVLALAKRLCFEHGQLRLGVFNQDTLNRELRGKTCAILGLGGVGKATLPLVRALGMRVAALNTSGSTGEAVDFVGTLDDLETVLRQADVVVISVPLTNRTRRLIGARELGWMRPDAILVNVARGQIVDEEALYRHLLDHPGFMAGLEVWWDEPFLDGRLHVRHPFLQLPNVLGCPHNSGIVPGWLDVGVRRAAANVGRYLNGEAIVGVAERDDYPR